MKNKNTQNHFEEINCKVNKNSNSISISNEYKNNPKNINNMNINVNKSIKSKSPNGFNNKEYPLKLRKIKNSIDIKRNYSQNESKSKINNYIKSDKNEYQIKI